MKTPTPPKETVIAAWDPEIEDEGYDCVLFKITTKELISEVLAQLLRQRLFMGYTIHTYVPPTMQFNRRREYVDEGLMVRIHYLDHALASVSDVKQMMKELFWLKGYELQFTTFNKLLNLKKTYR